MRERGGERQGRGTGAGGGTRPRVKRESVYLVQDRVINTRPACSFRQPAMSTILTAVWEVERSA